MMGDVPSPLIADVVILSLDDISLNQAKKIKLITKIVFLKIKPLTHKCIRGLIKN